MSEENTQTDNQADSQPVKTKDVFYLVYNLDQTKQSFKSTDVKSIVKTGNTFVFNFNNSEMEPVPVVDYRLVADVDTDKHDDAFQEQYDRFPR
jgi:hypothetical protein